MVFVQKVTRAAAKESEEKKEEKPAINIKAEAPSTSEAAPTPSVSTLPPPPSVKAEPPVTHQSMPPYPPHSMAPPGHIPNPYGASPYPPQGETHPTLHCNRVDETVETKIS